MFFKKKNFHLYNIGRKLFAQLFRKLLEAHNTGTQKWFGILSNTFVLSCVPVSGNEIYVFQQVIHTLN